MNHMTNGSGPYDSIIEDYYYPSNREIVEALNLNRQDVEAKHIKGNVYFSKTTVFVEAQFEFRDEAMWCTALTCLVDGVPLSQERRRDLADELGTELDNILYFE